MSTVEPSLPLRACDEDKALRSTIATIVGKFGHEYYQACADAGEPMSDLWDQLGRGGFLGLNIPEEYGGGGAGLTELAIVLEELSAGGCPELAMVLSQGIGGNVLVFHGS